MGEKTTRIDKARSNKNKKVSYRITITVRQLLIRLTDYPFCLQFTYETPAGGSDTKTPAFAGYTKKVEITGESEESARVRVTSSSKAKYVGNIPNRPQINTNLICENS